MLNMNNETMLTIAIINFTIVVFLLSVFGV